MSNACLEVEQVVDAAGDLVFTPFYQRWWKELDLAPIGETKATCRACTMVKPPQNETLRDPGPFDSKLKCCTYFPFVPNFSLGKINHEQSALAAVRRASARGFVSPLGLFPHEEQKRARPGFGTDLSQRCPFLNESKNSCSIWTSRWGPRASSECPAVSSIPAANRSAT